MIEIRSLVLRVFPMAVGQFNAGAESLRVHFTTFSENIASFVNIGSRDSRYVPSRVLVLGPL